MTDASLLDAETWLSTQCIQLPTGACWGKYGGTTACSFVRHGMETFKMGLSQVNVKSLLCYCACR